MIQKHDLYQILGIDSKATPAQIKEAYLFKANILHPDRLGAMPERIRLKAEDELKRVNTAYEVLSNHAKRREYDESRKGVTIQPSSPPEYARSSGKPPKPQVHPAVIQFNDASPYVPQKGSFFVRNIGGPFNRVLISTTPEWMKVVRTVPMQAGSKLPMKVDIQAVGIQWGKVYSSEVIVKLDDKKTRVRVKLHTRKSPR